MEDKVYTPTEVPDVPFPQQGDVSFGASQATSHDTYSQKTTQDQPFPDPRIAVELVGQALNTRSKKILAAFEFTPSGALQIGQFVPGVTGDVRITGNGITARNRLGDETFAVDGETGDAIFAGIIQAGTVISGKVIVGNNTWVIDGDPDTPRFLLYNNGIPEILLGRRA